MKYAIGLDIGGTKIEGVLADENGRVLLRLRTETMAKSSAGNIIQRIASVARKLKQKPVVGIGISIAGFLVDGKLAVSPNIPHLNGVHIRKVLEKELKMPVMVENDANCFALAEYMFGAAKGYRHVFGLIVGTGVGGGILIDGNIYSGHLGGAGELGHSSLTPDMGLKDGTGVRGTIESYCGGPFLCKHYHRFGGKKEIKKNGDILKMKDRAAVKATAQFYDILGRGVAYAVNVLNPEIIVMGGGIANLVDMRLLKKSIAKYALKSMMKELKVVRNKMGDSSGVLGAVALVFKTCRK